MGKHNFITVREFTSKNGMTRESVYCKKSIPEYVFDRSAVPVLIDELYFTRRDKFNRKVRNKSLDNYYWLVEYLTPSAIARLIIAMGGKRKMSNYTQFLNQSLFCNKASSILTNKVPLRVWEFWRYTRWLIQIIKENEVYNEADICEYIEARNESR